MNFETPKVSKTNNNESFFERIREGKVGKTAKAIALVASLAGSASAEAFDADNTSR